MDAKDLLKAHVDNMASMSDEQFDYFFSFFKTQRFKKGQAIISEGNAVLCLSSTDREKLCHELYNAGHFFRRRINKGYVAANKRLLSFMNNNVRCRYEEFLRLYPELYNIVPKSLIAAYLGVSRETISRLYLARNVSHVT